jgi:NitT/TauT family transport system substrate-binding protein
VRPGLIAMLLSMAIVMGACTGVPIASRADPTSTAAGASSERSSPSVEPSRGVASAPAQPMTIDVGFIPSLSYAPLYVAYEKGYFREQGLVLNLEPGGPGPTAQLGAGQLQIAGFGFDAAYFNALARGIEIRAILPLGSVSAEDGSFSPLVVRRELWDSGAVRDVADLRGRRVAKSGTTVGSIRYMLELALATGGLAIRDVDLVEGLSFPDIAQALAQGAIDASLLSEPFVTFSEERGISAVLSDRHDVGVQVNALGVNGAFARANPDAVTSFAIAYLRGARDLYGEGRRAPENVAIIEQYTKIPSATILRTRQPYTDPNGELLVDSILALQRYALSNAAAELSEPLAADQLIDPSFAHRAVAVLGPFQP